MTFTLTHPVEDVHHKGDPLGRSYTPDACALAIVQRLREIATCPVSLLEPCLGGGAFVRAAQHVLGRSVPLRGVTGVDIDPDAPGRPLVDDFVHGDFTRGELMAFRRFSLGITNPPFGKSAGQETTLQIVGNTRWLCQVSAMLLPLDVLTQAGWEHDVGEALEVWPLLPRPWEHDRGMCVLVHVQGRENEDTRFRPLRWRARG